MHLFTAISLAGASLLSGPVAGPWRAWLDAPGGELPFGLVLERDSAAELRATIVNGPERIAVPAVVVEGDTVRFEIDHYDSRILATVSAEGTRLDGEWEKRRGPDRHGRLPFHAVAGELPRFPPLADAPDAERVAGRWTVDFASDDETAVAIFEQAEGAAEVTGTFLTATGDYRWLAGRFEQGRLRLSVFDGAHAFLFDARMRDDGTLAGDFWSGDSWHETWTARRDEGAELADPFHQTRWIEGASLADLVLPDLNGRPRSLVDRQYGGRARVLQLFGSWCPNCHDETRYLTELFARYAGEGLSIVGLAFELTGDFERDVAQLRTFADRHDVRYPILLAGTANKDDASLAFPLVDRVRSYPTTIFLHGDGRVHSVHSGFAGPATGEAHEALRTRFEATIEELLAERPSVDPATWRALTAHEWYSRVEFAGAKYAFGADPRGGLRATYTLFGSGRPVISEEHLRVHPVGDAVWIEDRLFRLDREADVLVDPLRFGARLVSLDPDTPPFLLQRGFLRPEGLLAALADPDPRVRREAVWALTIERAPHAKSTLPEALPLLRDPDLGVRIATVWAFAELQDHAAVPDLLELRDHPNAALRRETATALARMSTADPGLLEALEPMRSDPDPIVRARAEEPFAEPEEPESDEGGGLP